jgi:hypothetical protein
LDGGTLGRRRKLAFFIFLHLLLYGSGGPGKNLDPSCLESGEGIGPHLSGDYCFNSFIGDELGGLDPGSPGRAKVGILRCLESQGIRVDDDKILAAAEAGIYL